MTEQQEIQITINYALIGVKLNALKLTLSDKDLEIYNNHVLDEAKKVKPILLKLFKNDMAKVDEVLVAFLK